MKNWKNRIIDLQGTFYFKLLNYSYWWENPLIKKFLVSLVPILICFNLLHCKKDPELEKLKTLLAQDKFQLKNFPADWNKPLEERTGELPGNVFKTEK